MPDNSLEKQVQELLAGMQLTPDNRVWQQVQAAIVPARKKRRFLFWWWTAGVLGLLAISWIGCVLFAGQPPLSARPAKQHMPLPETTATGRRLVPSFTATPNDTALARPALPAAVSPVAHHPSLATPRINTWQAFNKTRARPGSKPVCAAIDQAGAASPVPATIDQPGDDLFAIEETEKRGEVNTTDTDTVPLATAIASAPQAPAPAAVPSTTDTAAVVPARAVLRKTAQGCTWLPFIRLGVAGSSKGQGTNASVFNNNYANNPSSGGGSSNANYTHTYTRYTAQNGTAAALGLLVEKRTGRRWVFQTGGYYQYSSFRQSLFVYIDSISAATGLAGSSRYKSSSSVFHLHTIGIPLLWHFEATPWIGVSTGLVNEFHLLRSNTYTVNPGSLPAAINSTRPRLSLYAPAWWFSLEVPLYTKRQHQWRLAPYLQHGLAPVIHSSASQAGGYLWQAGMVLSLHLYAPVKK